MRNTTRFFSKTRGGGGGAHATKTAASKERSRRYISVDAASAHGVCSRSPRLSRKSAWKSLRVVWCVVLLVCRGCGVVCRGCTILVDWFCVIPLATSDLKKQCKPHKPRPVHNIMDGVLLLYIAHRIRRHWVAPRVTVAIVEEPRL